MSPISSSFSSREQTVAFRVVTFALLAAAALTFLPLWAPLVLAVWVAVMMRPLMTRIAGATGGRHRAAGGLLVLLVTALFVPIAAAVVALSSGAIALVRSVLSSDGARSALIAVVSGDQATDGDGTAGIVTSPARVLALVQEHGARAMQILGGIAGAAGHGAVALFVFIYAVYVFLIDGPAIYEWFEENAPLRIDQTRRLVAAFLETGRGLFIGLGLTGLTQGVAATVTYFALGVPRALVLGLLTCVASVVPAVGTALVWVPVVIGLALAGKTAPAIIMAVVGIAVIGSIDNVLRPRFARIGRLDLSTFVLLTSMFGGLAIFGVWGFVLGPLFARLAKEALAIGRASRAERVSPAPHDP